jgi:teichuronic acid biosynthesis glycosyltransferase TuaC
LLIHALRVLIDEYPVNGLQLTIVGEGEERQRLESLASRLSLAGRVHFAGAVPHEELYLWYSAADLFCLASGREGWPNVLLEALACGTPVVATAVGGIPEVIRTDDLGLICQCNVRALVDKLSLALEKPWQADLLRSYAACHTWERTAQAIMQIFLAMLDRGARILHHRSSNAPKPEIAAPASESSG